ncbi:carbamate kinase [Thermoactinomyces mirandus]|uniref:Carbamate kinase n=1 Tax=Thermoactinomyces mirandus TaxID=2756294 RepID=A0A7W2ARY0_9BACL|nr:carbamate kinase [Thermoactinomyces mirandus]MBA4603068.1 carbamate kinase [Thermoactinomyces mirandus]
MEKANKKIVVALGGNAIQSGEATAEAQQKAIEDTAAELVEIIKSGYQVVITHGNGPQVGNILLQQLKSDSRQTPAMPLDTCGAMSQGMIGYWMEKELEVNLREQGINKGVAAIVTRVEVDLNDEAFKNPSKPIGPYYSEEEAKKLMEETGDIYRKIAGKGWRKVVPSPKPINILEHEIIENLIEKDNVIICTGGGGVPVYWDQNRLVGVEGVIDKDFASQKLAELIDADILLILTEVENVYINYNKPDQAALEKISAESMKKYIQEGQFESGSMLPKVEAAVEFVESKPGRLGIITSLDKGLEALLGKAGTVIYSE